MQGGERGFSDASRDDVVARPRTHAAEAATALDVTPEVTPAPSSDSASVRTSTPEPRLRRTALLRLQSAAGNQAVNRLVDRSRLPKPGDSAAQSIPHVDGRNPVPGAVPRTLQAPVARAVPAPVMPDGSELGSVTDAVPHPGARHHDSGGTPKTLPPTPPAAKAGSAMKARVAPMVKPVARPPQAPAAIPAPVVEAPVAAVTEVVAGAAVTEAPAPTPTPAGGAPAPLDTGGSANGEPERAEPAPGTSDSDLGVLESSIDTPPPAPAPEPEAEAPAEPAPEAPAPQPAADTTPAAPEAPVGPVARDAEDDAEPVPDPAQGAAEAQADTAAEHAAEEQEAAADAAPGETHPEAVPEASEPAAAQAEGPDASTGDVATAANAEADASVAEGGDDDAGAGAAGGGGGGGGAAVPDPPAPAQPDVSGAPPEQGLAQAGSLPPAQLLSTLDGVQAAGQREADDARSQLAASPPTRPRSPGSPATVPSPASDRIAGPTGDGAGPTRVPDPAHRAQPTPPTPHVPTNAPPLPQGPRIPAAPDGGAMGEAGARAAQQAVNQLPTRDPGLAVPAAPAPRVQLDGGADPGTVDAQAAETEGDVGAAAGQATADAAHPLGEDELYPTAPPETLQADVSGGGDSTGGGGGAGAAAGAAPAETEDEAASIITHQEHGGEVRSAVQQGSGQITAARSERARGEQQERQQGEQEMARLEQENAQEQAAARDETRGTVSQRRAQWRAEQTAVVGTARADAARARTQAHADIDRERTQGDQEAARHHQEGQQEAAEARRRGEEEAARERRRAQEESSGGGFFSWVASKARAFVDTVKQGIQAAFAAARQAIQWALKKATELAQAAIERARQAAVALVKVAGTVLAGIASVALAAFPRLRDAAVGWIKDKVRAAEARINELANRLKEGVKAALNLLARALNGLLDLMAAAYRAAVAFVKNAVMAIVNKVKQAIQVFGQLAALVKDIAAGPGQWLRNLGAALMDGVRNHLWGAFKTAAKQWFNDKVEQVVGVGRMVWNLLVRGGLSLAKIGAMVWEGIKAAIPSALIALLIEKLVSLLIPAAAAVMLIIQGLQAAWGAASRVLQAFERFFAFLRAVKNGNAGPQFAQAVAAAATTVLDFLANFLIARLARGASKVGQKLRSIAQRIGQRLKNVLRRVGQRLRRVGQRIAARVRGLRDRFRRRKPKSPAEKRKHDEEKKQKRLDTAVAAIQPKVESLLARGVSSLRLKAQLLYWRIRYRLTSLTLSGGAHPQVVAVVNPRSIVARAVDKTKEGLPKLLDQIGKQLMKEAEIRGEMERIKAARRARHGEPGRRLRTAESPAAEAARLRGEGGGRQRPEGTTERLEVAPGAVVSEAQSYSPAPGHIHVHGIGGSGRYDPHVVTALGEMEQAGLSKAELRDAMFAIMGRQRPASHAAFTGVEGAERYARLAAITRLVGTVEPARHPGALATTFMGWSVLGEDPRVKPGHVVTDLNPMSPEGAGEKARRSLLDREGRAQSVLDDADEHIEYVARATTKYLEMRLRADPKLFKSEADVIAFIKTKLKDEIIKALRKIMWGTTRAPSGGS